MQTQEYENDSYPIQQTVFSHSSEGSLKFQIDIDEILEDLKHTLLGEEILYDPEKQMNAWGRIEGTKPMINHKGINSILTILRSRLTKIFILSDFEESTIEEITLSIGENVIDDLYYNWNIYELRDTAAASTILNLVTDTVFATLRKGYRGNYLKFLKGIHNIQEVQQSNVKNNPVQDNRQDSNILGALFGRRRR